MMLVFGYLSRSLAVLVPALHARSVVANLDVVVEAGASWTVHDVGWVVHPGTRQAHDELLTVVRVGEETRPQPTTVDGSLGWKQEDTNVRVHEIYTRYSDWKQEDTNVRVHEVYTRYSDWKQEDTNVRVHEL